MKKFTNKEIADYYDQTVSHYRILWDLDRSLAIHYGIQEPGIKTFRQSLQNTNRVLAEKAGISEVDYVLDAGCGVGGSAIYLAKNYNCRVKGITISERQVKQANENKVKYGLSDHLSFENRDYCNTGYDNNSFNVVWALESTGTAADKSAFIKESCRLLKPEGRLILADYFKTGNLGSDNNKIMKNWLNNWAISDLDTVDVFENKLTEAGYKNIIKEDYTDNIRLSSRRMYLFSFPGYITTKLYNLAYNATPFSRTHYKASLNQYRALKRGYWRYKIILARKG
jgi:cyclopropane fatty-acyl-phospholipid synthase-like methyltransferase